MLESSLAEVNSIFILWEVLAALTVAGQNNISAQFLSQIMKQKLFHQMLHTG